MKFSELKCGDMFRLININVTDNTNLPDTVCIKIFPLNIDGNNYNVVDDKTLYFFTDDIDVMLHDAHSDETGSDDTIFETLLYGDTFYAYDYPYLLMRCFEIYNDIPYNAIDEVGGSAYIHPEERVRRINKKEERE